MMRLNRANNFAAEPTKAGRISRVAALVIAVVWVVLVERVIVVVSAIVVA